MNKIPTIFVIIFDVLYLAMWCFDGFEGDLMIVVLFMLAIDVVIFFYSKVWVIIFNEVNDVFNS